MTHTTITSREFNPDAAEAYRKLSEGQSKITELLAYPAAAEVEFNLERLRDFPSVRTINPFKA